MRVLVTGENSYAGRQFEKRIVDLEMDWEVDFLSVRNDGWKMKDFSSYDAIYHVAAIVHQKEKSENESLYYKVNRDLTFDLAEKAKLEGVKSFVFLSTIAVYGLIGRIGEDTIISKETKENPTSYYGKSKLEAEQKINVLQSDDFHVSILRIPMIYGYGCPGNYSALSKLSKKVPLFPKINNKRSLIFVDHLSDLVNHLIMNRTSGLFLVKNPNDINTLEMVNEIAKSNDKKIVNSNLLSFFVKLFGNQFGVTRKMFGSIIYKNEDCKIDGFQYTNLSFEESIARAEGKS
ncbi:NAD-dependent epimerase/dehydratase family protein [Planococcus sp. S3-L1]|uniref:NAD-dependent epimerase/dehydratase family protein n=1 Tax=Planococcus sp. S3-L1 TaxID=3046200 RepID=UPI0024B93DE1|nr:NAD-dependent epimerase/dehydratase family protein [Planococcus sp. S3-L1]MDJ0332965.1 NAD-dependent epimerase/dehydratase family protein [Planococcus sp. S3-L1]